MLGRRMAAEERELLPALLNVFYYRETLFIVYELLRDNLYVSRSRSRFVISARLTYDGGHFSHRYHIYKYIEECSLPKYFTPPRLREVARQCLLTLECLHAHEVIHCDLQPEITARSRVAWCLGEVTLMTAGTFHR